MPPDPGTLSAFRLSIVSFGIGSRRRGGGGGGMMLISQSDFAVHQKRIVAAMRRSGTGIRRTRRVRQRLGTCQSTGLAMITWGRSEKGDEEEKKTTKEVDEEGQVREVVSR